MDNEKQAILRWWRKTWALLLTKATINITILDGENRDSLSTRQVINTIRKEAGPIYQAEIVTYGSQSAFGKPISVSLVGDNYEML